MITTKKDFTRIKGDSYPIKITLKKSKTEALDITGATVTMRVMFDTLTSFTANIIDGVTGIAEFTFTTSTFSADGSFKYEIELLTSGGIVYTVANGTIKVVADLG